MTTAPQAVPDRYLLVTFLVTREGEQGHPMDTIVKRVDLAEDGTPDGFALGRLTASIGREITRKAALSQIETVEGNAP